MNHHIEAGGDILSPEDMQKALCSATQLCGYKSEVLDVVENSKFKNKNQINKAAGRAILHKVHNLKSRKHSIEEH